jgi:hypothetical protein
MKTLPKHAQNVFENQHNTSKTFLKALLNPLSYHLVFNYQPNLKIMKTYLWKNLEQLLRGRACHDSG